MGSGTKGEEININLYWIYAVHFCSSLILYTIILILGANDTDQSLIKIIDNGEQTSTVPFWTGIETD